MDRLRTSPEPIRKWKLAVLAIPAVLVVGCVAIGIISIKAGRNYRSIFPPPVKAISFDSARWMLPTSSDFQDDSRAAMLDDLIARHDFTGWSRPELESILGKADDLNIESRSVGAPHKWDLAYHAGKDWIDFRVLAFELNEDGVVKSYRVELY